MSHLLLIVIDDEWKNKLTINLTMNNKLLLI